MFKRKALYTLNAIFINQMKEENTAGVKISWVFELTVGVQSRMHTQILDYLKQRAEKRRTSFFKQGLSFSAENM